MTGADRLRMEGRIEGRLEGRIEGRLESYWGVAHQLIGGADKLGRDAKTLAQDFDMPIEVIQLVEILQHQKSR